MEKKILEHLQTLLVEKGPQVLMALLTLVIGFWLIKKVSNIVFKRLAKKDYDPSIISFMKSMTSVGLKVLLLVSVAGMLGVSTASFVAIIGAAGLAVGLALQGSLSNIAGGVLILIFRPYKIGDLVEAQGHTGHVKEIQIFNTILITPENRTIILPNGMVSNGAITNYSKEGVIRVDLTVGIGYDESIKDAQQVLLSVLNNHPLVVKSPGPSVNVLELADSSVNLAVRPFCKPDDYWTVYHDILQQTKEQLDVAEISIPFPQRDVHMIPST